MSPNSVVSNNISQKIFYKEKIAKKVFQYKQTQADITLPQIIWDAFLLPNNLELLEKQKDTVSQKDQYIYGLKIETLVILENPKKLKPLSHITNPFHIKNEVVALLLLEILFALNNNTFSKKYIESNVVYWSSLADHFGFWKFRYLLEDIIFSITNPKDYQLILSLFKEGDKKHQKLFKEVMDILDIQFKKEGIKNFEILYRKKNIYGIYQKMKMKGKNINHMYDLFGFRILVNTTSECYRVLEILHYLWPHYEEYFADYIKKPKPNGYKSIHTVLQGLQKKTIEFQIRTHEMDYIAKYGPASHATYKKSLRQR